MSVPRFWREIPQRYTLRASRCGECGRVDHPPRRICPKCRRDSIGNMQEHRLSGEGIILVCTKVHRPAPGYALQVPYWMALIQTAEGPRLVGQVVETEGREPYPGLAVVATFRRLGEDGDAGVIHYGMKWRAADPGAYDEEE